MNINNKNIYIHVGYPKSASTTLQKHLFAKHSQLQSFSVYPTNNIGIDSGEAKLNPLYSTNDELQKFYTNLSMLDDIEYYYSNNNELFSQKIVSHMRDNKKSIIFSDEKLTSVFFAHKDNGAKAKRLAEIFPHAKIIFIIRNQYEWLKSQYRDHPFDPRDFTIGKHISFDKWFNILHWNKNIKLLHMLDYFSVIEFYKSLFGEKNVGVFLFEELAHDVNLFSEKISNYLEIDKEETLRILSGKHENIGVSHNYNIFRALKRQFNLNKTNKYIDNNFSFFLKAGEKKNYSLSERNIMLLNKYFNSGNKELSMCYGLNIEKYNYPCDKVS